MNLPISIEAMREEDLKVVAAIEKESFQDPWPLQSFATELQFNRLACYLVARLEGQIIAYIGAWSVLDEVHITTLAVDEPYRRRGVASRLLEALTDRALSWGGRCITLEVRPSNTAARRFYARHGFIVSGRRKRYYSDEDALIMARVNLHPSWEGKRRPDGES